MKTTIGISGNEKFDFKQRFNDMKISYITSDYPDAVIANGAMPLILPLTTDSDVIDSYLDSIDGLILSGGYDVTPSNYREDMLDKCESIYPARDDFEIELVKKAVLKNIPILAICRGSQISNVAFGGTLYQDLSYLENSNLKHDQGGNAGVATHSIKIIDTDSNYYRVAQNDNIHINSFHHQVIKDLADKFKIVAQAEDGVIEVFESIDPNHFFIATQYHPEMMANRGDSLSNDLFIQLINQADKYKNK